MTIPRNSLPAIFSNLAKASEKQQLYVQEKLFSELSEGMQMQSPSPEATLETIEKQITEDLKNQYPEIMKKAEYAKERGVQRALRWGEKVTVLQKSLIGRYLLKGDEFFVENDLFVCEACGFIFLGNTSPDLCPVCKAPKKRFSKVS